MLLVKILFKVIVFLPYSIQCVLRKNVVYLNAHINKKVFLKKGYNFGDDLNYIFLRKIIKEYGAIYNWNLFSKFIDTDNYLCVGSIIESRCNSKSIIWGSGCISYDKPFVKPKKVLAVRGPLTRKRLLDAGVYCPEIYGDPALLLPLFYKPNVQKKYKIGIIPHYVDKYSSCIDYARCMNVKIIDIQNYNDFKYLVDQVNECEIILSSSLHGIIVSDAYGIPNVWIELSNDIVGGRFKFYDYFLSVNRNIYQPIQIKTESDILKIINKEVQYVKPVINLDGLMNSCPFQLLDIQL